MEIKVSQLHKIYRGKVHALNGLNLEISSGMFGLLGPNGAGKTTLMRILAGILHPSDGELYIDGANGSTERGRADIKRILGYLPQELGMYPDLRAREFLDYVGILKGLDKRKLRQERVAYLLEMVALSDVANRKIKTFSGGMKRRVGIAQALLNDPQFLIVDEPTAGLDPEERIRFRNLLSDLGGERTVLLSTHIVEDISQTCQNIAVMKGGRVIFQGNVTQVLQKTAGKVWSITSSSSQPKPQGNFTIVSTLNMGTAIQYRVVGELSSQTGVVAVEPSLEDAYVWLMHDQHVPTGAPIA